jgi:hypothetical protein
MAATFDLEELVPDLLVELNTPGSDAYPTVSTTQWVGYLRNGFWSAYLDGLLQDYTESEGVVSPRSGSTPIPRDFQQLIIMYTAYSTIQNKLLSLQTTFRAKAGPVEYETGQSAQVLKALLDGISQRRLAILDRIGAEVGYGGIFYIDTYRARRDALGRGDVDWVGN